MVRLFIRREDFARALSGLRRKSRVVLDDDRAFAQRKRGASDTV